MPLNAFEYRTLMHAVSGDGEGDEIADSFDELVLEAFVDEFPASEAFEPGKNAFTSDIAGDLAATSFDELNG